MVTGKTLDNQFYTDEVQWWIASVPPYYCSNAGGVSADDLSTDNTWIGTSMTTAVSPTIPISYTNGVKFALVTNAAAGGTNPGNLINFIDSGGSPFAFTPLSDPSTPYTDPTQYLQTTYQIGSQKNPMFFGPYSLNKTNDGGQIADGDIIFITTGSDVIGGSQGAGPQFSANDNRSFNLIFYATGAADVPKLAEWVGDSNQTGRLSSIGLIDYSINSRTAWYQNSGVGAFVGIRSVGSISNVIYWPLSFDDSDVNNIFSINNS